MPPPGLRANYCVPGRVDDDGWIRDEADDASTAEAIAIYELLYGAQLSLRGEESRRDILTGGLLARPVGLPPSAASALTERTNLLFH